MGVKESQVRVAPRGLACTQFGRLEKEMAIHSSILASRIPWTEEPGGPLSIGSHRVGHDWSDLARMHALEKEMATHSSILAWRIPWTEEPGGLPSMRSHRIGHDWSDSSSSKLEGDVIHWRDRKRTILERKGNGFGLDTVASESEGSSVISDSFQSHGLYSPWNSPGQNTGVLSLSLLQGIFSTQRLNPGFLHCKRILSQHRKHDFKRIHILHRIKFLWGNTCIFSYILKVEFLLYIDHFKKIMKSPFYLQNMIPTERDFK